MKEARVKAIGQLIQHRLADLRRRPFSELLALDAWSTEEVRLGTTTIQLTTYCDRLQGGHLEVVVQGSENNALDSPVWRGVRADGFLAYPDGRVESLPDARKFFHM